MDSLAAQELSPLQTFSPGLQITHDHRCLSLFRAGIEKQFLALQRGFNELMPTHLLKLFDEKELELVISGLGKVDVEDWKINTRLKGCSPDSKLVKWFWKVCLLALLSNVLFAWL